MNCEKPQKKMKYYMMLAIQEAQLAFDEGEIPIGCVIVYKGKVIGRGHNDKELTQNPTRHAEMNAIQNASEYLGNWRLTDCTLYVTAEPCPMCMGAIIQSHISKLVFGINEKRYGSVETTSNLGQHPMLPKNFQYYGGICEKQCSDLLKTFFLQKR